MKRAKEIEPLLKLMEQHPEIGSLAEARKFQLKENEKKGFSLEKNS